MSSPSVSDDPYFFRAIQSLESIMYDAHELLDDIQTLHLRSIVTQVGLSKVFDCEKKKKIIDLTSAMEETSKELQD